jgi:hypothetical protein
VKADQWVVVNDGTEPYTYTHKQTVLNRNPGGDTLPSICENWLAAIPLIAGDKVIVAEDDDWIHPSYVETLSKLLDEVDLAGVREDLYWKLRVRKFVRPRNQNHASLGASAFRSGVLPHVERCCTVHKSVFIDMFLWAELTDPHYGKTAALLPNEAEDGRALHVGLKQMPGAAGLGIGHNDEGSDDPAFRVLRKWIGPEDCATYRRLHRELVATPS